MVDELQALSAVEREDLEEYVRPVKQTLIKVIRDVK